jgi:hypothetical protein
MHSLAPAASAVAMWPNSASVGSTSMRMEPRADYSRPHDRAITQTRAHLFHIGDDHPILKISDQG